MYSYIGIAHYNLGAIKVTDIHIVFIIVIVHFFKYFRSSTQIEHPNKFLPKID
jgi:hypothetical protein